MNIFKEIEKSIYSPDYYKKVTEEKFTASLSYFVSLVLVVSLAISAIISFRLLPFAKTALNNFGPELVKRFPENLVVTIKNGQASTNSEEPVLIPFNLGTSTPELPENLLVIDTKNPFNDARFREARTLIYLTKDTIFVANKDGGIEQSQSLSTPDLVIDRAFILRWLGELGPLLSWIPFIIVLSIFLVSLWFSSLILLELILAALIIMFASRLRSTPLDYKKAYQVGLHAVTPQLLLSILTAVSPALFFPFVTPVIGLSLTVLIFWVNFPPSRSIEKEGHSGRPLAG
jgi:hypothetical protein